MKRKSPNKHYIHLDKKKKIENYQSYIDNPLKVKEHGFFPFIHFDITFKKYIFNKVSKKKELKRKIRPIKYSAHLDRFIYQKYANDVNEKYNDFAKKKGIQKASIAYRNCFKGKNNIHFAKEVFEFLAENKQAYVFLGDFTNFFDNLDHDYLKKKLMEVLDVDRLAEDHYAVYKNICKYSYVKLDQIEVEKGKKLKEMNEERIEKFFETKEFHDFKRKNLKKNIAPFGIPQGSPISAVYANVYMASFDKSINDYVTSRKGIYRRYSDDIIIVLPIVDSNEYKMHSEEIRRLSAEIPRLNLQEDKTEHYLFNKHEDVKLKSLTGTDTSLNYLGFRFDGEVVTIRDKSLFKYYSRAYRKARTVYRNKDNKHHKVILRKLLNLYTYIGDERRENTYGNFITYAKKAHNEFSQSKFLKSNINKQIQKHWSKINKAIK